MGKMRAIITEVESNQVFNDLSQINNNIKFLHKYTQKDIWLINQFLSKYARYVQPYYCIKMTKKNQGIDSIDNITFATFEEGIRLANLKYVEVDNMTAKGYVELCMRLQNNPNHIMTIYRTSKQKTGINMNLIKVARKYTQ